MKDIFLKINIENVGKNDETLRNSLKEVLQFIYIPIREKEGYKKKSALSIYLIVLYLKISLKT